MPHNEKGSEETEQEEGCPRKTELFDKIKY